MRALLIEDDNEKASSIEAFVLTEYQGTSVYIERSFKGGLLAALTGGYDLILLDMTMTNFERSPNDDGGRPHHFGGREILRQLKREDIHVPVIVVTQFGRFGEEAEEVTLSELQTELRVRFPDYVGTVHYRSNVDDWKAQLIELINGVLSRGRIN